MNSASAELLLFGGSGHDEFLGCYDCGSFNGQSICNDFGLYGNEFSGSSIWQEFGTFGNAYSSSSPWNEYSLSNDVPVLVDRAGNFYGYFTINDTRHNAFNNSTELKDLYDYVNGDLSKLKAIICD